MDNNVTIRFYELHRDKQSDPTMKALLDSVGSISSLSQREHQLTPTMRVRLERLTNDGVNYLAGEVTRIQSQNLPSEVHPEGTKPLSVDGPLGHGLAFRLNHKKSVLAVQYDTRIMGPNRILQYLKEKGEKSSLYLKVMLRSDDLWKRFGRGEPKKFQISIANPQSLTHIANPNEPVAQAIRRMSDAYAAPKIEVVISMGKQRGVLKSTITQAVQQFFQGLSSGSVQVEKMRATVHSPDGDDKINFIEELLSEKITLDLPENDPDRSYELRSLALKTAMTKHGH